MFKVGFEKIKGGLADGIPDDAFKSKDVKKGMKVEREHAKSKAIQKEIAKDHLKEDPKYYDKLEKIEKKAGAVDVAKKIIKTIKDKIEVSNMEKSIDSFKKMREAGKRIHFNDGFKKVEAK